jgi:hypothetical protein
LLDSHSEWQNFEGESQNSLIWTSDVVGSWRSREEQKPSNLTMSDTY